MKDRKKENIMDEQNLDDNKHLERSVYLEERKLLIEIKCEESHLFDKSILYLNAGAFGLSLTFIKQIIPDPKNYTLIILIIAWVFFCFSLLSTLISFLTSQNACEKQIEILDYKYSNNHNNRNEVNSLRNNAALWTKFLNIISIVAFILGIIFLVLFTVNNLL